MYREGRDLAPPMVAYYLQLISTCPEERKKVIETIYFIIIVFL